MYLLIKNSLLKIKVTFGRFMSLFFIVALGLGFFSGVKSTSKDMFITADKYFDDNNLFDYKIVSTYGLTEEDLNSLKEIDNVRDIIGTYSTDVLVGSSVYRVHSITKDINRFVLKNGVMPSSNNECLAENGIHKIGDIIEIEDNDLLKEKKFKVVGLVESPLYIGIEKGISSIGNGKLNSFIYVNKDSFESNYYTEIYLTSEGAIDANSYSDEYDEKVEKLLVNLEELKPIRETKRYEEVLDKANKEITKNENKIKDEESKNRKKLEDAKKEIDKVSNQLNKAENDIINGRKDLLVKEKEANDEINKQEILLNTKEKEYLKSFEDYNNSKDSAIEKFKKARESLNKLNTSIKELDTQIDTLKKVDPSNTNIPVLETKRNELKKTYDNGLLELNKKEAEFNNIPSKLEEAKIAIDKGKKEISSAKTKIVNELASAKKFLDDSEIKVKEGKTKLNSEVSKYNKGKKDFEDKINEAYEEINDAREEVAKMPKPVWYLLDRTDQTGYVDFKNDALRVDNIAKVFPFFFLLVAALVCLNTMSRMVEEDRGEIGIYKALGYSNFHIIVNYFSYVIVATLFGGIVGLLIGNQVFPRAIYSIYNFTYTLPDLIIHINPLNFVLILLLALTITLSVTLYSCIKELKEVPSSLLRPKAPKKGKKVFLEHIPFIWNRLNFSSKVTIRNLFRYKKRIFMTIAGIAGCTALTLTGFGLKDGISSIINEQYTSLFKYDLLGVLTDTEDKNYNNIDNLLEENDIINPLYVNQELYNFKVNDKKHDFFLVVPEDINKLKDYILLQDRKTKDKIELNNDGAIITEKMANLLNCKVGDTIKIRNSNNKLFIIKVSGIVENYAYHYVYMTKEYFEKVTGVSPKYNMVYANINKDIDKDKTSSDLISSKEFLSINYTSDTIETFDVMISSLNKIVLVIILSSCLLAIIVLYNLTNINIIERKRELATLKVLGFYDKEVSTYVYRETMLLTLMGIGIGLILGVFLHRFVMETAEMDFIMFLKEIKPMSYVYASLITLVFSFIVEIFTHFKLKKIDMIESLKSVE